MKKTNNIVCLYTNADQFMNKRNEFAAAMNIYEPDIVGITEVKPKTTRFKVQESELTINNFDIFHKAKKKYSCVYGDPTYPIFYRRPCTFFFFGKS